MYTSKDLQRIFRVGRETVRYYEKIGIIHGQVDPQNGYHYYNDLDVESLARVLKGRAAKFSLAEIQQLHTASTIEDYQEIIEKRAQQLRREMQLDQLLLKRLDWRREELDRYRQHQQQVTSDAFFLDIAYDQYGFSGDKRYENFTRLSQVNDFSLADFVAVGGPVDRQHGRFTPARGGTAIAEALADQLQIDLGQLEYYQYDTVWRTYRQVPLDLTGPVELGEELAQLKMDYQLAGEPYLRQISVMRQQRLMQLNIPIKIRKG